jgi:hypothetical protein
MFMLATELPFQAIDNTFDAALEDVGGHADGSPALPIIGEDG